MKRPNMLSATFVRTVKTPGRYGDGGLGLSLLVRTAARGHTTKCWTQSVRIDQRTTSIGLGRYPVVTLALARQRALENARAIAEGRDPRRRATRQVPTFAEACETVISIHAGGWKPGGKNEQNWRSTMRDYVFPRLGDMPVDAVNGKDVMAVLLPIWTTKTETAGRVRRRINAVMKWAVAQGHHPMGKMMRRLEIGTVPHGFRSSFRDWTAECTETPREVCELALAHVNSDRVEAAYRRSDLFERRRVLMQQWADYLYDPIP